MPISKEMAKRYPADWDVRRRFIIQYRAKNQCEWCGAANGEPHPATGGRVLLNLAALCQRCHNRWDARDRTVSRARKRITKLLRAGQLPLPWPPHVSLPMALYQILLQTGQVGLPTGAYFQQALPPWAYEWIG